MENQLEDHIVVDPDVMAGEARRAGHEDTGGYHPAAGGGAAGERRA